MGEWEVGGRGSGEQRTGPWGPAGVDMSAQGRVRAGSPERKSRTCRMRSRMRLTSSSIWERLVLTRVSRR